MNWVGKLENTASDRAVAMRVIAAINALLENDRYLLDESANERALSHRLGMYLAAQFPEWTVD